MTAPDASATTPPPGPGEGAATGPAPAAGHTAKFCRYCGASLRDGAKFCPQCGLAVALTTEAALAGLGGSAGTTAMRLRSPLPGRQSWFSRLPAIQKVVLLVLVFVVVGSFIQAVLPGPTKCYYNCTFVKGPVQPAGATYSSPYFSFEYPSAMERRGSTNGSLVTLHDTNAGEVLVWGGTGEPPLASLVEQYSQKLPGTVLNLKDLGPIYGAQIGFVAGEGSFYSGDQLNGNSVQPVGAGVIAAEHDGRWAVVVAYTSCYDSGGNLQQCDESLLTSQALNLGDAQGYDDVLERWQWG